MIFAVIAIVIIVIGVLIYLNSRGGGSVLPTAKAPEDYDTGPEVAEFHVRGDTAYVRFETPISGDPDEYTSESLTAHAVEVVRDKKDHLPMDQVTTVVAQGTRDGQGVEVGRVNLETPGELPPPLPIPEAPHASTVAGDPLAAYSESLSGAAPVAAPASREAELGPAGAELSLPDDLVHSLAERGYEQLALTAGDLATELLDMAGYVVTKGPKADTYVATRGGSSTYLQVVDLGDYPEIDGKHINTFVVDFLASKADRGLLVSDRYGPFEIYEREKREPRVRFVTRERLQGFVDALTVG